MTVTTFPGGRRTPPDPVELSAGYFLIPAGSRSYVDNRVGGHSGASAHLPAEAPPR